MAMVEGTKNKAAAFLAATVAILKKHHQAGRL